MYSKLKGDNQKNVHVMFLKVFKQKPDIQD